MTRFPYRTEDRVIDTVKRVADRENRSANVMLDILVREALAGRGHRLRQASQRFRAKD